MATLTATSFLREPRLSHEGVTATTFRYGPFTASTGDVILLAKLPWGTTLVDMLEAHTSGATATTLDFGYDSDLSALMTAVAKATTNQLRQGAIGAQFTGSDDATLRYSILKALVSGGTDTTSVIIKGNIRYTFGD